MATKQEGMLRKWTNYLGNWQNRYFVLKDGILSYHKENPANSKSSCRGAIAISDASFKESKHFGIDVILKDCSWYIRAKDDDERKHWMKAFQDNKRKELFGLDDEKLNQLIIQQARQEHVGSDIINPPTTSSSPVTSYPTNTQSTRKPVTSIGNVALKDIMDSRKTLEEKAASWKETHPNGNPSQLLLKNPKEIFLDKHVPHALKCPICFEIFENMVYQCEEGHSVCSVCIGQINCCPFCKKRYGFKKMRNRLIEDLVNTEVMSCPGISYGCKYTGNMKNLENHVAGCFGFGIGEKLAQESNNDENSNCVGSLLVLPGNENRQTQSEQLAHEPRYLIEPELCIFVFCLCFLVKYFLEY